MEKLNCNARRLLLADVLERWPHVCRVKITFRLPLNDRKLEKGRIISFLQERIR